MYAVGRVATAAFLVFVGFAPQADAAVVIAPGADTVSTPRLELDFGDAGANVERLDSVRWRTTVGALTANLAVSDGVGGCDGAAAPRFWGEAGSADGTPQPVGSGSAGTWTARGGRTVQIDSSRPLLCTGDSTVTPVRTRYTFFNVGDGAGRIRAQRTISFSASTPNYVSTSMRAFVPRLALATYSQVIHPNAAGSALISDAPTAPPSPAASWNGTWLAIDDPISHAGVVILRESTSPARLLLEADPAASSAVDLIKPAGGWTAPVTETEWLCFYDVTSWPPATRSPTVLPSGCSIVTVPINTSAPVISGSPTVAAPLTATNGVWDNAASIDLQWARCAANSCTNIPGATAATYTPGAADEGRQLVITATATAPGGEIDAASSDRIGPINGGPPQSLTLPVVSGEAREAEVLTGAAGGWSDSPGVYNYQWRRCATSSGTGCTDVPGATASTYKLVRDDVGATMRLRVVAVNGSGPSLPADSAPTGEVQRLVVRAALSISPATTCTGVPTSFDASASKTPNGPIKNYRFTYKEMSIGQFFGLVLSGLGSGDASPAITDAVAKLPTLVLYDGPSSRASISFTWNRLSIAAEKFLGAKPGDFARDLVYMRVTVTDQGGATSTSPFAAVNFGQYYSSQSRASCPKVRAKVTKLKPTKLTFTTQALTAKIPCRTTIDCAGSLSVYTLTTTRGRARAARAKRLVIATNPLFSIRGNHSANIRAKLTTAGRALAKRGRTVRATAALTSIDPTTGRRTTHTVAVKLPGRRTTPRG